MFVDGIANMHLGWRSSKCISLVAIDGNTSGFRKILRVTKDRARRQIACGKFSGASRGGTMGKKAVSDNSFFCMRM